MPSEEEQQPGPSGVSRVGTRHDHVGRFPPLRKKGSCRKRRQLKPGHHTLDLLKSKKRSIVPIQNDHHLCCARALVTAKAKVDHHPKWQSFQRGGKIQASAATNLHLEAPCHSDLAGTKSWPSSAKRLPSLSTRSSWWMQTVHFTSRASDRPPQTSSSSCSTRKSIMMSSPLSQVSLVVNMCAATVSNPTIMRKKHRCKSEKIRFFPRETEAGTKRDAQHPEKKPFTRMFSWSVVKYKQDDCDIV